MREGGGGLGNRVEVIALDGFGSGATLADVPAGELVIAEGP